MNALSCIDQCFIADRMLEQLPAPSQIGETKVGGIDINRARMRRVVEALIALSPSPAGFTASELASQVRTFGKQSESEYGARRAAYDLKKLRGKQIVQRIGKTRRHESIPKGLRAIAALVLLRNKAIKPLLAAAQELRPSRGAQDPSARSMRITTQFVLPCKVSSRNWVSPHEHRQLFSRASPLSAYAAVLIVAQSRRPVCASRALAASNLRHYGILQLISWAHCCSPDNRPEIGPQSLH